jgi:PhnB protein
MPHSYKPENYNSVSPYMIVEGIEKLISLLSTVFDITTERRFDNPDGSIMHIEIRLDDSIIMMGEASDEFPANQHLIHVYVPDVDKTYQKALDAGCEPVEPPSERDGDPDRRGSFKDFAKNIWAISTQQS